MLTDVPCIKCMESGQSVVSDSSTLRYFAAILSTKSKQK